MGRIHYKSARFVDSRVKSDNKLLKYVELHPAIYDKNHKFYRNKQEKERIWKFIADSLKYPVSACKERWHQLLKEYKNCRNTLTLHDVTLELIREFTIENIKSNNVGIEDIEDDVLPKLFSEPEQSASTLDPFGTQNVDQEMPNGVGELPVAIGIQTNGSVLEDYFDDSFCESELMEEACSLQYSDMPFDFYNMDNLYWPGEPPPYTDSVFYNGGDVDDYYSFFSENNLNKHPLLFDDIVGSLFDYLDEDASEEARGDIVKLLCDRVKKHPMSRRQ